MKPIVDHKIAIFVRDLNGDPLLPFARSGNAGGCKEIPTCFYFYSEEQFVSICTIDNFVQMLLPLPKLLVILEEKLAHNILYWIIGRFAIAFKFVCDVIYGFETIIIFDF